MVILNVEDVVFSTFFSKGRISEGSDGGKIIFPSNNCNWSNRWRKTNGLKSKSVFPKVKIFFSVNALKKWTT